MLRVEENLKKPYDIQMCQKILILSMKKKQDAKFKKKNQLVNKNKLMEVENIMTINNSIESLEDKIEATSPKQRENRQLKEES